MDDSNHDGDMTLDGPMTLDALLCLLRNRLAKITDSPDGHVTWTEEDRLWVGVLLGAYAAQEREIKRQSIQVEALENWRQRQQDRLMPGGNP